MLDLSDLEQIPHFRSDQLYFIRMAGGYIRSIFWDVFLSSNKNRRKILYEVVDSLQVPTKDAEGHRIFCNSIKPNLETKRREGGSGLSEREICVGAEEFARGSGGSF
jgi:hypothetical protein